ncbi:MAG: hypothetical protein ACHQ9S_22985 [Candidatus Binatia bacterium]
MSVVLPTDTYATVRPVIERLWRQTVSDQLEIVIVAPTLETGGVEMRDFQGFAATKVVEVKSISPLAAARAAGVRAARAPLVFVGETHAFPHPRWAEALIKAHAGPWAVVAPAFGNANPDGTLSWAGLLFDYGRWADGLPAGEIAEAPLYNAAYRRSVLLEFGDRLENALSHGDELAVGLRLRGHRAYFEPAALIDHVNLNRPVSWVHERFIGGVLIGASRAARWSRLRRLVYVCGSPLIPLVLLWRIVAGVRRTARRQHLPAGTVPAMILGAVVKAAGEMVGYARGAGASDEARMTDYELHKVAYVERGGA